MMNNQWENKKACLTPRGCIHHLRGPQRRWWNWNVLKNHPIWTCIFWIKTPVAVLKTCPFQNTKNLQYK